MTDRQTDATLASLWAEQARQWALVGTPLRPTPQDVAITQQVIYDMTDAGTAPCVTLLFGVTGELVTQRWSANTLVLATDVSLAMIAGAWTGPVAQSGRHQVAQASWFRLPVRDGSVDLALGDGSLNQNPHAYASDLVKSMKQVLRSSGVATMRVFVRPDSPEDPQHVWAQLLAREIGTFNAFKFRALMSLCDERGDVAVASTLAWFEDQGWPPEDLAAHLGWPVETIGTINSYRNQTVSYWFPTLEDVRRLVAPHFLEVAVHYGTYELADRCPTFVWRARQ